MTYLDLIRDADRKLDKGHITLGRYEEMIEPLKREIQPEIIRCKDCKYMIDTGDDLMCDNAKGWVVATASDFGCVLAERRTECN